MHSPMTVPDRLSALIRRPVLREFSWLSARNQVSALLSVANMIILVRSVPSRDVGQVVFAEAVAVLFFIVLDPRFEDAVQRYFPMLRLESESRARALYWRLLGWDLSLGFGVAAAACAAWIAGVLPENALCRPEYLAMAICSVGVGSALGTLHAGFAVTGGLTSLGRRSVIASFVNAVITTAAVVSFGAAGYLAAAVVGSAVQLALYLPYCVRHLRLRTVGPRPGRVDRRVPAGFTRFLAYSSVTTSLSLGSDSGTLAVVGLSGGPELVALLRVAGGPARLLQSVLSPLSVQIFPRLSTLAAARDRAGVARLTARSTRVLLGPAALAVIVSVPLMAPSLDAVYGAPYRQAAAVAILFVVASALRCLVLWSKVLPLAVGRPGLRLVTVAVESIVVLAGAFLIPRLLTGVGQASVGIGALAIAVAAGLAAFWLHTVRRPDLLVAGAPAERADAAVDGVAGIGPDGPARLSDPVRCGHRPSPDGGGAQRPCRAADNWR